jgi:tetratricopeptide (TPR) repeat protein
MPATVLLFGIALGLLDALSRQIPETQPPRAAPPIRRRPAAQAAALVAAFVVVGGACWLSYGVLASSYWRGRAKAAMAPGGDRPSDPAAALAFLDRAAAAPRIDGVRFDIALRAAQLGVTAGRDREAYEAANRALALEPDSPHALAARAAASLALGDQAHGAEDARRALRLFLDLPSARVTLDKILAIQALQREVDRRMREVKGAVDVTHVPSP